MQPWLLDWYVNEDSGVRQTACGASDNLYYHRGYIGYQLAPKTYHLSLAMPPLPLADLPPWAVALQASLFLGPHSDFSGRECSPLLLLLRPGDPAP
jgi:hypothetical protein